LRATNREPVAIGTAVIDARSWFHYNVAMDKKDLISYLEGIDGALCSRAKLYVYGSAACILLDEPDRTSLDIDVAGPYSAVDEGDFREAALAAGIPVNPAADYAGDHIEWVGPLRLCLQPPVAGGGLTLWQGARLSIHTGGIAELVASKLIRYDDIDRSDIQYLLNVRRLRYSEIERAAECLPAPFDRDVLVRENLVNLRQDMAIWGLD